MKPGAYIEILKTRVERESWRTWIVYATAASPYSGIEFERPIRRITTIVPGKARRIAQELVGVWWPYGPTLVGNGPLVRLGLEMEI